ncbi:MAG: HAD-IA family hydrolase [Pseudomonadota bacterium]
MEYRALFFGSIGVVSETSELQRQAFNAAFDRLGLDWHWDREAYARMLHIPGGRQRIAEAADAAGMTDIVDVGAVYAIKQGAFDALVASKGAPARPGVIELMKAAKARGMKRAFVTTTSRRQVDTVFRGLRSALGRSHFDFVGERAIVDEPKPAPEIYHVALSELGLEPEQVLCIEDTPESAQSALEAGIRVIGFPGRAAYAREFPQGVPVVEFLSPALLTVPAARIAAE